MSTFRQYLFLGQRPIDGKQEGEGTKAWLDVMVWSSAQPHSVGDMVENCFGAAEGARSRGDGRAMGDGVEDGEKESGDLVAIWARDTLGLTEGQYRKSSRVDWLCEIMLQTFAYPFHLISFRPHLIHSTLIIQARSLISDSVHRSKNSNHQGP